MTPGRRTAVCAVLALFALLALAPTAPEVLARHYYTELYRFPGGGTQGSFPTSAVLDLTVGQNGSISGYYRPTNAADGAVISVMGTLSGSNVTLEIGGLEALHVNATLSAGKLLGRAYRFYGNETFYFIGRPIPNDSALPGKNYS